MFLSESLLGSSPAAQRAVNVALHAGNTVLVQALAGVWLSLLSSGAKLTPSTVCTVLPRQSAPAGGQPWRRFTTGRDAGDALSVVGERRHHAIHLVLPLCLPGGEIRVGGLGNPGEDIQAPQEQIHLGPAQPDGVALRQIADENDILLILDEVQTGIGRTGTAIVAFVTPRGATACGPWPRTAGVWSVWGSLRSRKS